MCALFLTNAIWWRKCPPRWDVPKIVGGEERPSFLSECCWWPLLRDHLNSLHILSQDAVFIERSSIQEAALFVLLYNKSVQDLTPKHRIICSSLQIYLTSFYLHSCYVAAGQASMHFRLVVFALCVCVCVCVFAKHTRDNTNDKAV